MKLSDRKRAKPKPTSIDGLFLHPMSIARIQMFQHLAEKQDAGEEITDEQYINATADALAECLCDEDGKRLEGVETGADVLRELDMDEITALSKDFQGAADAGKSPSESDPTSG